MLKSRRKGKGLNLLALFSLFVNTFFIHMFKSLINTLTTDVKFLYKFRSHITRSMDTKEHKQRPFVWSFVNEFLLHAIHVCTFIFSIMGSAPLNSVHHLISILICPLE